MSRADRPATIHRPTAGRAPGTPGRGEAPGSVRGAATRGMARVPATGVEPMILDEEAVIRRATEAHARRCDRMGHDQQQPCGALSRVERGVVVLENARGELARYRVARSGRIGRKIG